MVVEVSVAEDQTVDALPHQLLHCVIDPAWVTVIPETAGELPQDARLLLGLVQQQTAGFRGDRSPLEGRHHRAPEISGERKAGLSTLCHSEKPFLSGSNVLSRLRLCQIWRLLATPL